MCTKGTPARVRLSCHCSHVWAAGTAFVAVLVAAFVWTHLLLLLGMAGLVSAGTFAAVRYLMRYTTPVIQRPAPVAASPAPAGPAPAPSAPDVVSAAQAIADAAFDARTRP